MILSSHILPEVEQTCERVVIISEGNVVAEDTPENLTARMKGSDRVLLEVEGDDKKVEKIFKAFPEVTSVQMNSTVNGLLKIAARQKI